MSHHNIKTKKLIISRNHDSKFSLSPYAWKIFILLTLILSLIFTVSKIPTIVAADGTFTEDFTTTTYRDSANTNVSGWGTGTIELPMRRPELKSTFDTPHSVTSVYVSGNYAYVTDAESGVANAYLILDISDPLNPILIGNCSLPDNPIDSVVVGNYAYIANGPAGLVIVNVANPSSPFMISQYDLPEYTLDIGISGNFAYVVFAPATGTNTYFVSFDVSNPSNPTLADSYHLPHFGYGLHVSGNRAYVACWMDDLLIFDISNPYNLYVLGGVNPPGESYDLYVEGNYAYQCCSSAGLQIIDVSNPANPYVVSSFDTPQVAYSVFVSGTYAYIADIYSGLRVAEISNPLNPINAGAINPPGTDYGVYVSGNYAYLASATGGLHIIEVEPGFHLERASLAVAQSLTVYSAPEFYSVVKANLTASDSMPIGTSIDYYLSADDGSNWEQVIKGNEHSFSNAGANLKWKAILHTSDPFATPTISWISINYSISLKTPLLLSPEDGYITNNTTPIFEWENVSGATSYQFQLDTSTSFNSPDLINLNLFSTTYTPPAPLTEGTWYWRVASIDSEGYSSPFSNYRTIVIDITPPNPPILLLPYHQSYVFDNTPYFEWNVVSDANRYNLQIDNDLTFTSSFLYMVTNIYSVNFTVNTSFPDGIWYWRVCSIDNANNQGPYSAANSFLIDTVLPSGNYSEDFTTFYYNDSINTDIYGWGSGAIALPEREPIPISLCATYDFADEIFISGDYAYVADGLDGLTVVDISDPQNPFIAGNCDTPDYADGVTVSGDYAFIADRASGLQVMDISDPTNPFIVGNYDNDQPFLQTVISGDYAYIANFFGGLLVINISNPANPLYAGSCITDYLVLELSISGDFAFVSDQQEGIKIINITDPTLPEIIGSHDTNNARDLVVSGNYVYVNDYITGLMVFDVSNPKNPINVANCSLPSGNAAAIFVLGDFLYLTNTLSESGYLYIIDISDPINPYIAGYCETIDMTLSVFVDGCYAYIATSFSGVQVIRISDPISPSIIGFYDTSWSSEDIYISGDYAYVADGQSGLQVIDISDPSNPILVADCDTLGYAYDIQVAGNIAYIADGSFGLWIVNISDPTGPSNITACDTPNLAQGIFISGNYAYVADGQSGLQVIDISDPSNPILVADC
ncbi:MAG: LVIVD repeat-containing protein, partial [Candidatus Heimdallarchaeota archaeon]